MFRLSSDETTKGENTRTGDGPREELSEERLALGRRVVDELAISGL